MTAIWHKGRHIGDMFGDKFCRANRPARIGGPDKEKSTVKETTTIETAAAQGPDEATLKREWDQDVNLQKEFDQDFEVFVAFKRAEASGRVRMCGKSRQ